MDLTHMWSRHHNPMAGQMAYIGLSRTKEIILRVAAAILILAFYAIPTDAQTQPRLQDVCPTCHSDTDIHHYVDTSPECQGESYIHAISAYFPQSIHAPENRTVQWTWDDGTETNGPFTTEHSYAQWGNYTIVIKVKDLSGRVTDVMTVNKQVEALTSDRCSFLLGDNRSGQQRAIEPSPPRPTDGDGDGTYDSADQCPSLPGPTSNHGCPENEPGEDYGWESGADLVVGSSLNPVEIDDGPQDSVTQTHQCDIGCGSESQEFSTLVEGTTPFVGLAIAYRRRLSESWSIGGHLGGNVGLHLSDDELVRFGIFGGPSAAYGPSDGARLVVGASLGSFPSKRKPGLALELILGVEFNL